MLPSGVNISLIETFPSRKSINIGSDVDCYVFVKWADPDVQPKHARLTYENDKVYIFPFHPVEVNRKSLPIEKPYPLKHDDIITFGPNKVTKMRYIEKREDATKKKKPTASSATQTEQRRKRIKITPRN